MISPEMLRFFPFFAGQSDYMLKEIAILSEERSLEAGEWLFRPGDPAYWLYVVQSGSISLTLVLNRNGNGEQVERMGGLGRGEVVGWSALVQPYEYCLGAQASERTKLISIEASGLRELLDDNPQFGYYLMKNISEMIGERLKYKCIQLFSLKV